jgi:hypothetical protein
MVCRQLFQDEINMLTVANIGAKVQTGNCLCLKTVTHFHESRSIIDQEESSSAGSNSRKGWVIWPPATMGW